MAKTHQSILAFLLLFNILISAALVEGRDIPTDVKHPENFFTYDRSFLIPGIGRVIVPKSKEGFNPFTYNPVTGSNNGLPGFSIPSIGGIPGNIPGSDDTFVPNPGVEVPVPGAGDNIVPVTP